MIQSLFLWKEKEIEKDKKKNQKRWLNRIAPIYWNITWQKNGNFAYSFMVEQLGTVSKDYGVVGWYRARRSWLYPGGPPYIPYLKLGSHWPSRWPSENEHWTSSGTNLFLGCVGSFWKHADGVRSDSTCKVWERWRSEDWSHWIIWLVVCCWLVEPGIRAVCGRAGLALAIVFAVCFIATFLLNGRKATEWSDKGCLFVSGRCVWAPLVWPTGNSLDALAQVVAIPRY